MRFNNEEDAWMVFARWLTKKKKRPKLYTRFRCTTIRYHKTNTFQMGNRSIASQLRDVTKNFLFLRLFAKRSS